MLNSVTAQYARRLADTNVIVNACCPGYVATDFTGFNAPRTPEQGAAIAIRLATLPSAGSAANATATNLAANLCGVKATQGESPCSRRLPRNGRGSWLS